MAGLAEILKTGFELSNLGQRYGNYKRQQSADMDRRRDDDARFTDMVNESGGKFVHGDTVDEDGILRPADKSRVITHRTADGEMLRFELPTPEQQLKTRAQRMYSQFGSEKGLRDLQTSEAVDRAGREEAARLGARTADRNTQLQNSGVQVPARLGELLPGIDKTSDGKPRIMLPADINDLIQTTGSFSNMMSQIDHRDDPKARKVQNVHFSDPDTNGEVTQTITYDDGSSTSTKMVGKYNPKKSGDNSLTPYQQYEIGHTAQREKQAAIDKQQAALDKLQQEESGLLAKNNEIMRRRAENKAKLGFVERDGQWVKDNEGDPELTKSQRGSISEAIAKDEAEVTKNNARIQAIQPQKKTVDAARRGMMGQRQSEAAQGAASAVDTAKASAQSGQAVTVGTIIEGQENGKTVRKKWSGQAWVPVP